MDLGIPIDDLVELEQHFQKNNSDRVERFYQYIGRIDPGNTLSKNPYEGAAIQAGFEGGMSEFCHIFSANGENGIWSIGGICNNPLNSPMFAK